MNPGILATEPKLLINKYRNKCGKGSQNARHTLPIYACQEETDTHSENAGVGLLLKVNPGAMIIATFHWALSLCQAPRKGGEHLSSQ